jgi:hypothetical protein
VAFSFLWCPFPLMRLPIIHVTIITTTTVFFVRARKIFGLDSSCSKCRVRPTHIFVCADQLYVKSERRVRPTHRPKTIFYSDPNYSYFGLNLMALSQRIPPLIAFWADNPRRYPGYFFSFQRSNVGMQMRRFSVHLIIFSSSFRINHQMRSY